MKTLTREHISISSFAKAVPTMPPLMDHVASLEDRENPSA